MALEASLLPLIFPICGIWDVLISLVFYHSFKYLKASAGIPQLSGGQPLP